MSKILVTGGAGAIGSFLVRELCREHEVLVLDDLSSGWMENLTDLKIRFWRGSICDDELLNEVFAERPEVVFHLAANFANQNSVDYPQKDLLVNGMGTLKILEYSRRAEVQRFIYTSSSCVYGASNEPLHEGMVKLGELDTPYAVTKLTGEQYVSFFQRFHGMQTTIFRLFNSYGPGEYPGKYRNVIPNFFYRAIHNLPIVITGTGQETRDFTYISDTVHILKLGMEQKKAIGQTFNTGTGRETGILDLAQRIISLTGSRSELQFQPRRDWDHITRRVSDVSHLKQALGFQANTALDTGLERTYAWFCEKNAAHVAAVN
ncbi:MAG: NAD-dependent epimerase/dehydratase family protein [Puniceicoccaceae bacterium]